MSQRPIWDFHHIKLDLDGDPVHSFFALLRRVQATRDVSHSKQKYNEIVIGGPLHSFLRCCAGPKSPGIIGNEIVIGRGTQKNSKLKPTCQRELADRARPSGCWHREPPSLAIPWGQLERPGLPFTKKTPSETSIKRETYKESKREAGRQTHPKQHRHCKTWNSTELNQRNKEKRQNCKNSPSVRTFFVLAAAPPLAEAPAALKRRAPCTALARAAMPDWSIAAIATARQDPASA